MDEITQLLTVYSATVERRNGSPVVSVPARELELGPLEAGETYRVAVLSQPDAATDSAGDDRAHNGRGTSEASGPPVVEGERREVEIEDLGEQGDGIARVGPGYVVFVPGADIGDRITVEIVEVRSNFAFADVVEDEPISG